MPAFPVAVPLLLIGGGSQAARVRSSTASLRSRSRCFFRRSFRWRRLRPHVAQIEGDELPAALLNRLPHRLLVVGVERHSLAGPAAGDVHLFGVDCPQRGRRHAQDHPVHGAALARKTGFHKAEAEMPGILADDPAVIEPDVAARGEFRDGVRRAVPERVLAVERLDRAGEPDHVARRQADGFRPVERELARVLERHRRRVGDGDPLALS